MLRAQQRVARSIACAAWPATAAARHASALARGSFYLERLLRVGRDKKLLLAVGVTVNVRGGVCGPREGPGTARTI